MLDTEHLRILATCVPVIGVKSAVLKEIWQHLGGDPADCPCGEDHIAADPSALAQMFQVEPARIMRLHRKHAATAEEKAILTTPNGHPLLFALVDIAMMVTQKPPDIACIQVKRIVSKHPGIRCIKTTFGDGPKRWAGDFCAVVQVMTRLGNPGRAMHICRALGAALCLPTEMFISAAVAQNIQQVPRVRDEAVVERWLRKAGLAYQRQEKIAGKRVDFVVQATPDLKVYLEVDEEQHKAYSVPAEVKRMKLLRESTSSKVFFLRLNLGDFEIDGVKSKALAESRKDSLLAMLAWAAAQRAPPEFAVTYLYYDMDKDLRPSILMDMHYPSELAVRTTLFDYALQMPRMPVES